MACAWPGYQSDRQVTPKSGFGHTRASGEQVSYIQKHSQSGHARARCEALT